MALEPAGVSLQAEGFSDYIRKLEAIEKKNRQVFDTEFKGTAKSFAQVTAAAKKYEKELKDLAEAEKKAEVEAKKLAAAQKTAAATQRQAFLSTGQAALSFAQQTAQAAFELGKLGAQFQGQQVGLRNLAGSFGQSGKEIQRAIQDASKGTLSGLDAIQAANQGLLLGVAKTPEEFANLTNSALTLGRTLGLEATQSIEQFTSALGRRSLLILDNFGISAKQVNAEIERLAQADFGVAASELTEAQKQANFMKAALNIAGDAAATIGDEAGEALASFDKLTAASKDLKTELGLAISDLNQSFGVTEGITKTIRNVIDDIKLARFQLGGGDLDQQIEATQLSIERLREEIEITEAATEKGGLFGFIRGLTEPKIRNDLTELEQKLSDLNIEKAAQDAKTFKDNLDDTPPIIEDNTKAIEALQSALRQAEQLQLSFARAAEDAALKQSRALEDLARKRGREEEDIARNQAKSIAELQERQAKDRDKLLKNQAKQFDKFEKGRQKQIAKAEGDIAKARKQAADKRKEDQRKLQRELQRAQERFNLSRLQSERRFSLSERRLRAEGDILAIQQLREDRELERKEEAENFGLSQKDRVRSAEDQQREQSKDLDSRVNELKSNLEEQRSELLKSFDEQLAEQQQAQAEAQARQQKGFEEQAAERAIALAREEEDRKIALEREEFDRRASQARQLEDLGRSLAEQKDVTEQGVTAIAGEIEKVFGMEGVADNIFSGFSERTKSEFNDLIADVEDSFKKLEDRKIDTPLVALTGAPNIPKTDELPLFLPGFDNQRSFGDGGVVPGPIGSPQIIEAHAGETVLPTHQRSFVMAAPVIPSQILEVAMSGGFNITGDGQADEAILRAAVSEMTETFGIAVRRVARRN
jgi:hypothetical protein